MPSSKAALTPGGRPGDVAGCETLPGSLRRCVPAVHLPDAASDMAGLVRRFGASSSLRSARGGGRAGADAGGAGRGDPLYFAPGAGLPGGALPPVPGDAAPAVCAGGVVLVDPGRDPGGGNHLPLGEPPPALFEPPFWLQNRMRLAASPAQRGPMMMSDPLQTARQRALSTLLAARNARGHWGGRLSSSALSTATAVCALATVNR